MPKLPKSVARNRGQEPAKKKPAAQPKGNGKAAKNGDTIEFEHRQVGKDAAASNGGGTTTAAVELNKFERGLLSDLFAVIEEHAQGGVDQIDRGMIERLASGRGPGSGGSPRG